MCILFETNVFINRFFIPLSLFPSCPQGEPGLTNTNLMKGQKGQPGIAGTEGLPGIFGLKGEPGPTGLNGLYN